MLDTAALKQQQKKHWQRVQELKVLHLRLTGAQQKLSKLDLPISLLGIAVNQEFIFKLLSIIAAGAGSGISKLVQEAQKSFPTGATAAAAATAGSAP